MKIQSLIKKSSFVSIICLALNYSPHSKAGLPTGTQLPQNLFSCLDANKRWDYVTLSCVSTKNWQKLPETFKDRLDRPLNLNELNQAKEEMKLYSDCTISKKTTPHAIILIGTAGSGKSTLVPSLGNWLGDYNEDNYVQFDGDILRRNHKDYMEISLQESVAYTDAWLAAKPHFSPMKTTILDQIIGENRNVIIPTGVHGLRYYNIMKKHGYHITILGIYVDFKTALYRGMNRAEWTGRTYTGSYLHWQTGLKHMYALSKESKHFPVLFINNSNFEAPSQMTPKEVSLQIK